MELKDVAGFIQLDKGLRKIGVHLHFNSAIKQAAPQQHHNQMPFSFNHRFSCVQVTEGADSNSYECLSAFCVHEGLCIMKSRQCCLLSSQLNVFQADWDFLNRYQRRYVSLIKHSSCQGRVDCNSKLQVIQITHHHKPFKTSSNLIAQHLSY